MGKKAEIWEHFEENKDDHSKVTCRVIKSNGEQCQKIVSRGTQDTPRSQLGTTSMHTHLKQYHPKLHADIGKRKQEKIAMEKRKYANDFFFQPKAKKLKFSDSVELADETNTIDDNASCSDMQSNQLTLKASIDRANIKKFGWGPQHPRQLELNRALGEWIALDNEPFSLVQNDGFKRFMDKAIPLWKIPDRHKAKDIVINDIYNDVKKSTDSRILDSAFYCFTTDLWKKFNKTFIGLTLHSISDSFDQECIVLHNKEFIGEQSADNIQDHISSMIKEQEILESKIHVIVSDSAPNMRAGVERTDSDRIPCFLHNTQLVIKHSILEQKSVINAVQAAKSMVSHFKFSSTRYQELNDIQKELSLPQNQLISECVTRWNSILLMFERLVQQKRALNEYCDRKGINGISNTDWTTIDKVAKILKFFEEITIR